MSREFLFNFRINAEERRLIETLAQREERTVSDTMRRLIRAAVQNSDKEKAACSVASTTERHVEMATEV